MCKKKQEIVPRHQWTNGGKEVLVVRWINHDGTTCAKRLKDGEAVDSVPFKNPLIVGETVTAEDWDPKPICGGGIHGWAWAFCVGEGKDPDWSAIWQVYGVLPGDVIEIEGKVKFRTGTLRYSGDWHGAMMFVLNGQMAWVRHASSGAATASGDSGAATASGCRGAATASGDRGAATASGDSGAATASGYRGAATASGDSGAATASGDSGAATASGEALSAIVTGLEGKARAPEFGCIALAWWNKEQERIEMRCALIGKGEGKLKPDTWYVLSSKGIFKEESQ